MPRPWVLRLAIAIVACGTTGATSVAGQVVTGRITTVADGTPLPGVAITLFDTTRLVADVVRTDSVGRFRLRAPAPGSYRVYVVHSGFAHYVGAEWFRLEHPDELRLDIALHPTDAAQALPAVVIAAERESIRKRRVDGRDLRAVEGEIFTRSEIAMSAADAVTLYDVVRGRRIGILRLDRSLCLTPLKSGYRRGVRSTLALWGSDAPAFGGSDRTSHCLEIRVDEVVWASPGDAEDAYYAVTGHMKPDDIDWMFVERGRGAPNVLHIYTKNYSRPSRE